MRLVLYLGLGRVRHAIGKKPPGPRMTIPTQLVLRALLAEPTREMYGLQIGAAAGLPVRDDPPDPGPAGTRVGWLTSRWEDAVPAEEGRPRRRYYQLTQDGAERARIALAQATTSTASLRLAPRPAGGTLMSTNRARVLVLVRADVLARALARASVPPTASPASSPAPCDRADLHAGALEVHLDRTYVYGPDLAIHLVAAIARALAVELTRADALVLAPRSSRSTSSGGGASPRGPARPAAERGSAWHRRRPGWRRERPGCCRRRAGAVRRGVPVRTVGPGGRQGQQAGAAGPRGPGGRPDGSDAARTAGPGAPRGGAVRAAARGGGAAAAVIPAVALARLGLPALITATVLAACVLAAACWVLASDARAGRVAAVLAAWRGVTTPAVTDPVQARPHCPHPKTPDRGRT